MHWIPYAKMHGVLYAKMNRIPRKVRGIPINFTVKMPRNFAGIRVCILLEKFRILPEFKDTRNDSSSNVATAWTSDTFNKCWNGTSAPFIIILIILSLYCHTHDIFLNNQFFNTDVGAAAEVTICGCALLIEAESKENMVYGTLCRSRLLYNPGITSPYVHSSVDSNIYHGQPYARVDLSPLPYCQSRLYPPVRVLDLALDK